MGAIPNLNFQPYNPMDTAIKTALGVYGAGMEGQSQATQNKLNKAKLPYVAQQEEERLSQLALANQLAQYDIQQAEAQSPYYGPQAQAELQRKQYEVAKAKAVNDYLQQMLGGGMQGGQPGEGAAGNAGFGNDMADQMFRQLIGMPAETPNERANRELSSYVQKENIKKGIEKSQGTTSTISAKQNMDLGIQNTLPVLDELMEFDVPGQGVEKYFAWDDQPKYESMVANIADKMVAAYGLPKTNESLQMVKSMVELRPMESKESYRERLKSVKNELKSIQGRIGGNEASGTEKSDPLGIR